MRSLYYFGEIQRDDYQHDDLENVVTPINVQNFENWLHRSEYDPEETHFLVQGFKCGFSLEYMGPRERKNLSNNLPFKVGDKHDMWSKIMKEVSLGRYAGPYTDIPYSFYVQSPVGLVLKANDKTRLIFHLSYDFPDFKSVNHYIPKELCSVSYRDLDTAVKRCIEILRQHPDTNIWIGRLIWSRPFVYCQLSQINGILRF